MHVGSVTLLNKSRLWSFMLHSHRQVQSHRPLSSTLFYNHGSHIILTTVPLHVAAVVSSVCESCISIIHGIHHQPVKHTKHLLNGLEIRVAMAMDT